MTEERSPREEMIVQAVSLAALLIAAALAPYIQRVMSDPDISYRFNWYGRKVRRQIRDQLHELGFAIDIAVSLYQVKEYLRKAWRNHGNPAGMGNGDPEGAGGDPLP